MVGNACTFPVTAAFWLVAPVELRTTFPEILPIAAEAADRTYNTILLTVPPDCVSVTLLPYPLPAASDTWKFAGAVATIFAVKPLPETVNC